MLLKLGSKGKDVEKLQLRLGLKPDGDFGPITEAKVKEWQLNNGLTSDGIVGTSTWGKLFSISNINLANLVKHIPDIVIDQIPDVITKFNINTPLRLVHLLAQCSHESANFTAVYENLNYSSKSLRSVFTKYFPTDDKANQYARKPEKIANLVYANRMGNGSEQSGDGWKYRGRGYIQLTGKDNYTKFDFFVDDDIVNNPDLVATKYPLLSAAFFFNSNNLWTICDKGSTESIVKLVSKRVNGGTIGLADRIKHFNEIYFLLTKK